MTMTPSEAITYLHGTAPTDPDDIDKSKRYQALAALEPLIGRDLEEDAALARVVRLGAAVVSAGAIGGGRVVEIDGMRVLVTVEPVSIRS